MDLEIRDQYQSITKPTYNIFLFPTKTDKKIYKIVFPYDVRWKEGLKIFYTSAHLDFLSLLSKTYDMLIQADIASKYKLPANDVRFYGLVEQGFHALLNLHGIKFSPGQDLAFKCTIEKLRTLVAILANFPRVMPQFPMFPFETMNEILTIIEQEQV